MASRKQKRVLRYVEEGSLLKLKSYLRKHTEVDVNFSQDKKKQRSPLHLACKLGDDAVLRLLLKHGADVLRKDVKGDTALHLAANRALKHGKRAYDELVVPLRNRCPEAMDTCNNAGITPKDLLMWMKDEKPAATRMNSAPASDPEKEWRDKLFGECEDEFLESFGVYDADDFLPVDDDEEDFGDWADKIRREYFAEKHAEAQRLAAAAASSYGGKRSKSRKEVEEEEKSRKELTERLQREHEEYLARAARKEDETKRGKKRRYEERCAATFQTGGASSSSSSAVSAATKLSYGDIPWPAPRGTVAEMVDVMLHGADRKDLPVFRKLLKRQQTLWHPDKFAQRCGARLAENDRQRILDTVTALSQELNRLSQSLK